MSDGCVNPSSKKLNVGQSLSNILSPFRTNHFEKWMALSTHRSFVFCPLSSCISFVYINTRILSMLDGYSLECSYDETSTLISSIYAGFFQRVVSKNCHLVDMKPMQKTQNILQRIKLNLVCKMGLHIQSMGANRRVPTKVLPRFFSQFLSVSIPALLRTQPVPDLLDKFFQID